VTASAPTSLVPAASPVPSGRIRKASTADAAASRTRTFSSTVETASSASGESQSHVQFDSSHFGMSFKITQVPIVRPWFKTAFLASKLWRFDPSNPEAMGDMVSDGGKPPKGLIPAYPTSLICIKDLTLCLQGALRLSPEQVSTTSRMRVSSFGVNLRPL